MPIVGGRFGHTLPPRFDCIDPGGGLVAVLAERKNQYVGLGHFDRSDVCFGTSHDLRRPAIKRKRAHSVNLLATCVDDIHVHR